MTQEYTPTTEKVKQAYSGLHEKNYYDFDATQREENFNRWLAAHDAQIRAKALTLSDDELSILEGAYSDEIERNEGDGIGSMSIALKAVAEHRKEEK